MLAAKMEQDASCSGVAILPNSVSAHSISVLHDAILGQASLVSFVLIQ